MSISNLSIHQRPAFKGGVSINLDKVPQETEEKFEKEAAAVQKENPGEIVILASPLMDKNYMGVFFSPKAKKQEEKFIEKMSGDPITSFPNISEYDFEKELS